MEKSIATTLYQCALCTLKFPFEKIKYSTDGKRIICIDCYSKVAKKSQKANEAKQRANPNSMAQYEGKGVEVMCANCSYKFQYKPNFKPRCPYCGGSKIRKYENITANKLLQEASTDDLVHNNRSMRYL